MASKTVKKAPPKAAAAHADAGARSSVRKGMPLSQINIKQAVDLGDGFVLVKVDSRAGGAGIGARSPVQSKALAFLDELPTIPKARIKTVFQNKFDFKPQSFTGPVAPTRSTTMPPENRAFMERFERQELAQREELAKAGLLLESGQLADKMRLRRQSISKAVQEKRMFSLHGASGRRLYPAFFAAPQLDRKQVQKVSRALGDLPGPSKWQFFTTPKVSLGGKTAIQALENGEVDAVLVAAAGFLES